MSRTAAAASVHKKARHMDGLFFSTKTYFPFLQLLNRNEPIRVFQLKLLVVE